jgi:peptidoglycan/xylan/chitin deacetylase (PgdA/CDA1 family)
LLVLILVVAGVTALVGGSLKPTRHVAVTGHRVHASIGPEAVLAHPRTSLETRGYSTIRRLAKLGLPIYCAGPRGHDLAFTFDDGPGPYTHYAIKKLLNAHERATFFVVGRSMGFFPGWLPRELRVAAIGDHTSTHPLLPSLSPAEIASEIESTKQEIEAQTGQSVYLFRPPYGALDPTVLQTARQLGLLPILWSVDSRDSLGANWAGIIRNVEAGLRPGAIILMHENRGQTIRALTTLLPVLHRRHLRSVSLPELFATDPPSVAQVRHGEQGCGTPVKVATTAG